MNKVFHLSAGLGDCIYSLPTIQLLGGGTFVYGTENYPAYKAIKPLMELQPCIKECVHTTEVSLPKGFTNLDWFRSSPLGNKAHLVNLFRDYFKLGMQDWNQEGWLKVDTIKPSNNYAVVNVTPRYRDKVMNKLRGWRKEIDYLKTKVDEIYFLGEEKDFVSFCQHNNINVLHPEVSYLKTPTLVDAAGVIKGANIFSGNQSVLLAIRQSLGLPYRFEQSPNHVDSNQYSDKETVINPNTRRIHLLAFTLKRIIKNI